MGTNDTANDVSDYLLGLLGCLTDITDECQVDNHGASLWAAIRGRIDGQFGDVEKMSRVDFAKEKQRQADFIISSFLGFVFVVIFSYGSDGIHNHEKTPFGRICLELFPSIEEGNPRFLSLHFSSF